MFPLLIQALLQHLAVPADSQLWNIFFSLNRKACLDSWELPGMFLLVDFKCCAEALLSGVLFLAVAREELLPRVLSCAGALGCCTHELNIWGPPSLVFSCVLHCLIPNLVAWKPHKKCLCLIDRLGPGCKCQPKVSKWVTARTRILRGFSMPHDEVIDSRVVQLSIVNHGDQWLRKAQAVGPTRVITYNDMTVEQIN